MKKEKEVVNVETWTARMEGETIIDNLRHIWREFDFTDDEEFDFDTFFLAHMVSLEREKKKLDNLVGLSLGGVFGRRNHQSWTKSKLGEVQYLLMETACFSALRAMSADQTGREAWLYACQAREMLGALWGVQSGLAAQEWLLEADARITRSTDAATRARQRWSKDPSQKAKEIAKGCWDEWQKNPGNYRNQVSFANDVLEKVEVNAEGAPVITFNTIIKKYIPEWRAGNQ